MLITTTSLMLYQTLQTRQSSKLSAEDAILQTVVVGPAQPQNSDTFINSWYEETMLLWYGEPSLSVLVIHVPTRVLPVRRTKSATMRPQLLMMEVIEQVLEHLVHFFSHSSVTRTKITSNRNKNKGDGEVCRTSRQRDSTTKNRENLGGIIPNQTQSTN